MRAAAEEGLEYAPSIRCSGRTRLRVRPEHRDLRLRLPEGDGQGGGALRRHRGQDDPHAGGGARRADILRAGAVPRREHRLLPHAGEVGHGLRELDQISSTTFRSQATTSKRVANESPELYYDIQHLNPHSRNCLDLFLESVGEIEASAMDEDGKRFVEMMEEGKEYFGED